MAPIETPPVSPSSRGLGRLALVLGALSGVGGVLVMPYLAALLPELEEAPLPLWALALLQGAQTFVLATGLGYVGLRAGRALGVGAPLLEGARPLDARGFGRVAIYGVLAAGAMLALEAWVFGPLMPPPVEEIRTPSPWLGLLASFYGGVTEEVLSRLFAMSGIAWLLVKGLRVDRRVALVLAATAAAALFGVAHLPTALKLFGPEAIVVVRTVALNMVVGVPLGLVYARRGLEHAIVMHFAADLVLHVLVPALSGAGA